MPVYPLLLAQAASAPRQVSRGALRLHGFSIESAPPSVLSWQYSGDPASFAGNLSPSQPALSPARGSSLSVLRQQRGHWSPQRTQLGRLPLDSFRVRRPQRSVWLGQGSRVHT